ncbi:ComEC/Rec2 family competence protein [Maribacter algicola]|uniref:ComEC/Rec2 family competence protein n=1 Tax=Meishania litoralis TaxID=3434685 RepID=A0ACC7LGV1_9FLAO
METRYIKKKTAKLYTNDTDGGYEQILIYGEEVKTSGQPMNGRIKATYRNKYEGYVNTDELMVNGELEIYFIDVGQGDAALVVTPNRKKILIDGGANGQAKGFLQWKYQLADLASPDLVIDLMVLSHADGDHLKGLIDILEHPKIEVKRILHNGIGLFDGMDEKSGDRSADGNYLTTYHSGLADLQNLQLRNPFDDWIALIQQKNIIYTAVNHETGFVDTGDPVIAMEILGPVIAHDAVGNPRFKWFKNHPHTINGHSVVFSIQYDKVRILFSGDVNIEGSKYLLEHPGTEQKLRANVLKTPHHGSHEFHPPFLAAVRPQISVVSSGDSPDHGHPRANFIGAIGLASRSRAPLVFSTEIASTFTDVNEIDLMEVVPDGSLSINDIIGARLFKKRLNGMINVRTDGKDLYAMRRVTAWYWWESYGPLHAEDFPTIL